MYIYIYRWGREGVRERERAGVRKRDLEREYASSPRKREMRRREKR